MFWKMDKMSITNFTTLMNFENWKSKFYEMDISLYYYAYK